MRLRNTSWLRKPGVWRLVGGCTVAAGSAGAWLACTIPDLDLPADSGTAFDGTFDSATPFDGGYESATPRDSTTATDDSATSPDVDAPETADFFCALLDAGPNVICADFDLPQYVPVVGVGPWTKGSGLLVSTTDSSVSPPNSMLVSVPATSSTTSSVSRTASIPPTWTSQFLHVEVEVRLTSPTAPPNAAVLEISGHTSQGGGWISYLDLSESAADWQINNGSTTPLAVDAGSAWHHYALDFTFSAASTLRITYDHTNVVLDATLPTDWRSTGVTVALGLNRSDVDGGPYQILLDNFLCTNTVGSLDASAE